MFKELSDSLQLQLNEASILILSQEDLIMSLRKEQTIKVQLLQNYQDLEQKYDLHIEALNKEIQRRKILNYILVGTLVGILITK